uniref:BTB domain-containing protein n=1 Tax=Biomphalaria glabrata TaxID=6526 RepID=A0A2C9M594_BIOGL
MVIKREVAYGIVQSLSDFWKCEELQDFTVTVGNTKFRCHRFLMAACSGFFRGLFRSGMKETESNCVTVEDISSETFELILETLYTGRGVLTNGNVNDIWRAAHQLQIIFLITECENFVIKSLSLESYIDYFQIGKVLNSETVTKTIFSFILNNASSFFKTHFFLELPFKDVLNLVKNQNLKVHSENDVNKAILKWTEYNSEKHIETNADYLCYKSFPLARSINDKSEANKNSLELSQGNLQVDTADGRKDGTSLITLNTRAQSDNILSKNHTQSFSESKETILAILLANARTCLSSHDCLEMLMSHPLVGKNKVAREVVTQALLYQLQIGKRNGQWPTAAIHRNNSVFANVALITKPTKKNTVKIQIFSFSGKKLLKSKIEHLPTGDLNEFCVIDHSLYYFSIENNRNIEALCSVSVKQLTDNSWSQINTSSSIQLKYSRFFLVSVNEFIFILQSNEKKMLRLEPTSKNVVRKTDLPNDHSIGHVTFYENLILLMVSDSVEGVDETQVHCYDTLQDSWSRLNNLEGPAKGMTSFKDDQSTYLLQSNGNVWKIVRPQSNILDFEFEHVVKLWSCDWPLHGAVTFMDKLYIYGVKSETRKDDLQLRTFLEDFIKW